MSEVDHDHEITRRLSDWSNDCRLRARHSDNEISAGKALAEAALLDDALQALKTAVDRVHQLEKKVEELTIGSRWRERILTFLFEAQADDEMKDVVDYQVRMRMGELCRTEEEAERLREENERRATTLLRVENAVQDFAAFLGACYGREVLKVNAEHHLERLREALIEDVDSLLPSAGEGAGS